MADCADCGRDFDATYMRNGRAHKCCATCRSAARGRRLRVDPSKNAEYQRALRRKYREDAIAAYGGRCACCQESRYEFLVIDHPEGGGRKEREFLGKWSSNFVRHLATLGYPSGYRVLCHNCNSANGYYGYCPHAQTG